MAVFNLEIQALGPKADGICNDPRGRVFVDRSVPGDQVAVDVWEDAAGLNRGEIVEMLQPSPFRREAPCPHYDQCGNCTLLHVTPNYYRDWKQAVVREAFKKVRVSPKQWREPIFLPGGTRRRATFAAYRHRGQVVMGYYRRRTREIGAINECQVADPRLLEVRNAIRPYLRQVLVDGGWPADIFLQLVGDTVDMAITGPVGLEGLPDAVTMQALETVLMLTPVGRVSWRADEEAPYELLLQRESASFEATFGSIRVALPPAAFLQPTPVGEKALVDAVLAALPAAGHFADLFSGSGTFAGSMLQKGSVDAFEAVPEAVHALSRCAGLKQVKAHRRDLFASPLRPEELQRYDAVVFDPPRGGCPEQALMLAKSAVPLLIGVSCNPATFARDARFLKQGGYSLESLQIVDQFVGSHHVEMVGVFSRPPKTV